MYDPTGKIVDWLGSIGFYCQHPILQSEKPFRFSKDGAVIGPEGSCWLFGGVNYWNNKPVTWAVAGDFKDDSGKRYYYQDEKEWHGLTDEEVRELQREIKAAEEKARAEEEKLKEEARAKCQRIWEAAKLTGTHPYLHKKGLPHLFGARILEAQKEDKNGKEKVLVIPFRNKEGEITTIQYINSEGKKRYAKNGQKAGSFFEIPPDPGRSLDDEPKIYICEGYATGCSIHMATGERVVVAGDTQGLLPAAKVQKDLYPDTKIVFGADNDAYKPDEGNPGYKAASNAAKELPGSVVIVPVFKNDSSKPTDFNDLHQLEGIDEVVRQINSPAKEDRLHSGSGASVSTDATKRKETAEPVIEEGGKKSGEEEKPDINLHDFKKITSEDLERLIEYIIEPKFKILENSAEDIYLEITNTEKKEVNIFQNPKKARREIYQTIKDSFHVTLSVEAIEKIIKLWEMGTNPLKDAPKSFTWEDEDEWTFKKLEFKPTGGSYPAWSEFLMRLSAPQEFMAFVWSIFEQKNKSRQFLYLYDPAGEGGKSTVIKVLGDVFGNSFAAINNSMINQSSSRWFLSSLYGKRLAAWADCKNPKFCMSEHVRNITSGDNVTVEFKGGHPFTARMYLKLIIGSNHEPQITSGGADTSRLIRIDVKENIFSKNDPKWEDRLKAELPYFLYECKNWYEKICQDHGKISLSESTKELVEESTEGIESKFECLVQKHFQFGEELTTSGMDFLELCRTEKLSDQDIGNLKDFLKRKYNVKLKRKLVGNEKIRIYGGLSIIKGPVIEDRQYWGTGL